MAETSAPVPRADGEGATPAGTAPSASFARGPVEKLLYTPTEAATLLSISRSKVYELMGSGRLAYVLVDRSRRVPGESLRRFVGDELQRQGFPPGTYLSDPAASLRGQMRFIGREGS